MSMSSRDLDASVIVLNNNGRHWLENCLAAMLGQMNDDQELTLVDNRSTDESVKFVRARFPAVRVLALDD